MSADASATAALTDVFAQAIDHARRGVDAGRRVVATAWPTVPNEIVRAAGLCPFVVRRDPGETPAADARLERGVFSSRIRTLLDVALCGNLDFAALLILPRTSEQDYKAFLYLQEFASQAGPNLRCPPSRLFDLLQSSTAETRAYDDARLHALGRTLESFGGRPVSAPSLAAAIDDSNRARRAARALLSLRQPHPRISGAVALPLLGAFWLVPPEEYAGLATKAAAEWATAPILSGPRVLLAGVALDHPLIHRQLEEFGAVVTAERSPWGTLAAGRDIDTSGDPFSALLAKYIDDVDGPRVDGRVRQQLFRELTRDIDGVVFVIPDDDSVAGWDYPAERAMVEARDIPHVLVRGSGATIAGAGERDRVAAFVDACRRPAGTSHG